MGIVADLTAVHAHRRVFVYERPTLVRMTLEAGLLIRQYLVHHVWPFRHPPCRRERAMRVVAVRARHDTLVDPVLEWHRELRADVGMATIAKLGLHAGQQEFRRRRLMDRMAIDAYHVVQRVQRAPDVSP